MVGHICKISDSRVSSQEGLKKIHLELTVITKFNQAVPCEWCINWKAELRLTKLNPSLCNMPSNISYRTDLFIKYFIY